jgi:probable addiction module antidote protein
MKVVVDEHYKLLKEALASNDLQKICQAVDTIIACCGVSEVAQAAGLDRTTLYRAFRIKNGPSLDTASKVFRALGLQLVVTLRSGSDKAARSSSPHAKKFRHEIALGFTRGFVRGDTAGLVETYQNALRHQENTAKLAMKMGTRREHLYRIFSRHPNPRLGTVVNFLNELGLHLSARRQ